MAKPLVNIFVDGIEYRNKRDCYKCLIELCTEVSPPEIGIHGSLWSHLSSSMTALNTMSLKVKGHGTVTAVDCIINSLCANHGAPKTRVARCSAFSLLDRAVRKFGFHALRIGEAMIDGLCFANAVALEAHRQALSVTPKGTAFTV